MVVLNNKSKICFLKDMNACNLTQVIALGQLTLESACDQMLTTASSQMTLVSACDCVGFPNLMIAGIRHL